MYIFLKSRYKLIVLKRKISYISYPHIKFGHTFINLSNSLLGKIDTDRFSEAHSQVDLGHTRLQELDFLVADIS